MTIVTIENTNTLKRIFKYILSTLLFLSLIVLGDNICISCPNVKYYKETERISTTNSEVDNSKCFHYNQNTVKAATNLNIKLWSNECILYYNQSVAVTIISQTNLYCEISPIIFLKNRLYIPRKSIKHHCIS